MQQVQFMSRKLRVYGYQQPRIGSYYINQFQIILGSIFLSTLVWMLSGQPFVLYLVNGLIVPRYFGHYGVDLKDYWFWFAILLLLRTLLHPLRFFDSVLLVCLWHPNINLAASLNILFPGRNPSKKTP